MLSLPRRPASVPLKSVQTLRLCLRFLSLQFCLWLHQSKRRGRLPPLSAIPSAVVLGHVASSPLPGAITTAAVAVTRDHVSQAPSCPAGH